MPKTALNLVNEVLKQAHLISGSQGELTTFTDSARQGWIDRALQAGNETIDELYNRAAIPMPTISAEFTITLVAADRDYAFTGAMIDPPLLVDETNGRFLTPYPGGWNALLKDQPIPSNFTGTPNHYVIEPVNGQIYLDREPTASEAGLVYKGRAQKDGVLAATTDNVTFEDKVFRAVVPAVVQQFLFYERKEFAQGLYDQSLARAARLLRKEPARDNWQPRVAPHSRTGIAFPFED